MKNLYITIIGMSVSLFLIACGNPLDILGPRDKPSIINDDWKSIVYKYNFRVSGTKTIRKKISITDKAKLDEIKKTLYRKV